MMTEPTIEKLRALKKADDDHGMARAAPRSIDGARHRPPVGLLHHTDRGSTYTAAAYRSRLRELGMVQSMSRRGNCWDNAVAESTGFAIASRLTSTMFAINSSSTSRSFYNRHRLHSTLDYVTPNEKLQLLAAAQVA